MQTKETMTIGDDKIIRSIYAEIFLKEVDTSINVFICGASTTNFDSIRDKLYQTIKNDTRFNVVFPEWLFGSLLSTKNYNLLELENLLAEDVDGIVIPLEGLGTIAELGAFTTNKKLLSKIIVINNAKFKNSPSFINLGPIRLVKNNNRDNLLFFNDTFENEGVENTIRRLKSLRIKQSKYDLKNLFNLARFINYIIALYQPITKIEIISLLSFLPISYSESLILPCIEILIKRKKIIKDSIQFENNFIDKYSLSPEGHDYVYEKLLARFNLIKVFCRMRATILNKHYRKLNKLKVSEVVANF